MSNHIQFLRERVEEGTAAVERYKRESQEAQAREQQALKDLSAYQQALDAELRRDGMSPDERTSRPVAPVVPASQPTQDGEKARSVEVRKFIVSSGERGVKPRDIAVFLDQSGLAGDNPTYHYGLVNRLVTRKEVENRNGRYVATERMREYLKEQQDNLPMLQ